jgi:hypothetical protein
MNHECSSRAPTPAIEFLDVVNTEMGSADSSTPGTEHAGSQ